MEGVVHRFRVVSLLTRVSHGFTTTPVLSAVGPPHTEKCPVPNDSLGKVLRPEDSLRPTVYVLVYGNHCVCGRLCLKEVEGSKDV